MTTAGQVNPTNAPRDAEKLQLLGPFMLKRLMETGLPMIGVQFDEARRSAFMRDPIDKRAKDVLDVLTQIDASGGGAPAPTPAAASAPAPAATDDKPARTPVSRKANGTSNGVANGASDADGLAVLQGIAAVIKEVAGSIDAMSKTVKSVESGAKKIDNVEVMLNQVLRFQHLQMAVLAQVAENALGCTMEDVLASIGPEYDRIEPTISKLISGK